MAAARRIVVGFTSVSLKDLKLENEDNPLPLPVRLLLERLLLAAACISCTRLNASLLGGADNIAFGRGWGGSVYTALARMLQGAADVVGTPLFSR